MVPSKGSSSDQGETPLPHRTLEVQLMTNKTLYFMALGQQARDSLSSADFLGIPSHSRGHMPTSLCLLQIPFVASKWQKHSLPHAHLPTDNSLQRYPESWNLLSLLFSLGGRPWTNANRTEVTVSRHILHRWSNTFLWDAGIFGSQTWGICKNSEQESHFNSLLEIHTKKGECIKSQGSCYGISLRFQNYFFQDHTRFFLTIHLSHTFQQK